MLLVILFLLPLYISTPIRIIEKSRHKAIINIIKRVAMHQQYYDASEVKICQNCPNDKFINFTSIAFIRASFLKGPFMF